MNKATTKMEKKKHPSMIIDIMIILFDDKNFQRRRQPCIFIHIAADL